MRLTPLRATALICALAAPAAATANIAISFRDSAPKDIFVLRNDSGCDLGAMTVTLDLSASASGLIFDTRPAGAGVEVYQPFEIVAGGELLTNLPEVGDGMTRLDLNFVRFPAGQTVQFTIDVDDTLPRGQWGQIRVSGGEMAGAEVVLDGERAAFQPDGTASLPVVRCMS